MMSSATSETYTAVAMRPAMWIHGGSGVVRSRFSTPASRE